MFTAKRITVGLVLAASALQPAAAITENIWTSHGPEGGAITALAIDPQSPATLYAGTHVGGIFKSIDSGASWQAINTGLVDTSLAAEARLSWQPRAHVAALAIDPLTPATVYAGTLAGSVFKSTNGGGSWRALNIGRSGSIYSVTIDPRTPTTLYVGLLNLFIKSIDGGDNWQSVPLAITWCPYTACALAIDPQTPSTLYATNSDGLFKSTDGGANWHASNIGLTGLRLTALVIDPQTPTTIYAGAAGWPTPGGVFKSTDGGDHWSPAGNTGLTPDIRMLAIDPRTPTTLFAVADNIVAGKASMTGGLFKSTDGGISWRSINAGLTARPLNSLVVDPKTTGTLYAGNSIGVFKSADGGGSWRAVNAGLSKLDLRLMTLAIDPQTATTVYAGASYAVYKTTDGGGSWRPVGISLDTGRAAVGFEGWNVSVLAVDPTTATTIYAGTGGAGVFKSTDGGSSWHSASAGLSKLQVVTLVIDPRTPTILYAGMMLRVTAHGQYIIEDPTGVFKSTDGAGSWVAINNGLPDGKHVLALAIDPQSPTTLYMGIAEGTIDSANGAVYKTTNGGRTWVATSDTFGNVLAVDPRAPKIVYAGGGFNLGGGVRKSTDGGGSWRPINTGLTDLTIYALVIDPSTPATIYVGTGGGIFKSTDGGGTWNAINAGLTGFPATALAIDPKAPSTIYAATRDGVFVLHQ